MLQVTMSEVSSGPTVISSTLPEEHPEGPDGSSESQYNGDNGSKSPRSGDSVPDGGTSSPQDPASVSDQQEMEEGGEIDEEVDADDNNGVSGPPQESGIEEEVHEENSVAEPDGSEKEALKKVVSKKRKKVKSGTTKGVKASKAKAGGLRRIESSDALRCSNKYGWEVCMHVCFESVKHCFRSDAPLNVRESHEGPLTTQCCSHRWSMSPGKVTPALAQRITTMVSHTVLAPLPLCRL